MFQLKEGGASVLCCCTTKEVAEEQNKHLAIQLTLALLCNILVRERRPFNSHKKEGGNPLALILCPNAQTAVSTSECLTQLGAKGMRKFVSYFSLYF